MEKHLYLFYNRRDPDLETTKKLIIEMQNAGQI